MCTFVVVPMYSTTVEYSSVSSTSRGKANSNLATKNANYFEKAYYSDNIR